MDNTQDYYLELWIQALEILKKTNKTAMNKQMEFSHASNNTIYINAFTEFKKNLYTNQYSKEFSKIFKELNNEEIKILFIVEKRKTIKKENTKNKSNFIKNENIEDIEDKIVNNEPKDLGSLTKSKINNLSLSYEGKLKDKRKKESNLNPRYTFDSFIMGDNTSLAYNVSLAISKEPGITYNPCLIYGGVGLGKTHLLQSIGNSIITNKHLKVLYVTAENFTNEFINSLDNKAKINQFKNKYRKVDVLLIDDIHFLQNKQGIQEELFHTFNDLYETKRQMVFTCDRPIQELKSMTDRLKNRFSRGINVDLRPPEYETKVKIIRVKNSEIEYKLSDSVIDYLSQNINTNVRDLEAAFNKLAAFSKFTQTNITLDKAKELIDPDIINFIPSQNISVDKIIRATADFYQLTYYDIKSKKRNKKIVTARQIAMYLSRELTSFSTTEIGYYFDRDHTTIMHAIEKIEKLKSAEKEIENSLKQIKKNILI